MTNLNVTLEWLSRVLQQQPYLRPELVYRDVQSLLEAYGTLLPRTDVYINEQGRSDLLLTISGTLRIAYRGASYNVPISFWIPLEYPQAAPICYVNATGNIYVRPGNYVDPSGRIYHPYLTYWTHDDHRPLQSPNLIGLCQELAQVFSQEPPVAQRSNRPPPPPKPTSAAGRPASAMAQSSTESLSARVQSPPLVPPKPEDRSPIHGSDSARDRYRQPLPLPSQSSPRHAITPQITQPLRQSPIPALPDLQALNIMDAEAFNSPSPSSEAAAAGTSEHPTEKMAVLRKLQQRLMELNEQHLVQSDSVLQREMEVLASLKQTINRLGADEQYLEKLRATAQQNIELLPDKIGEVNSVIMRSNAIDEPEIDTFIVAPDVVSNQLYELIAEDRAIEDTMYVLATALDQELIGLDLFIKTIRNLAREQFMKKALVKKISDLLTS